MTPENVFAGLLILAFVVFVVLPLAALAIVVAWWAFRMVFWIAIIFISEAGRAWRGELR